MSGTYYNRQGRPISLDEWISTNTIDGKRVAFSLMPVEGVKVSTVWLGISHGTEESGKPIIFETMIFMGAEEASGSGQELYCERYSSEEDAKHGHDVACMWAMVEHAKGRLHLDDR